MTEIAIVYFLALFIVDGILSSEWSMYAPMKTKINYSYVMGILFVAGLVCFSWFLPLWVVFISTAWEVYLREVSLRTPDYWGVITPLVMNKLVETQELIERKNILCGLDGTRKRPSFKELWKLLK